jgi:hypothetical protein
MGNNLKPIVIFTKFWAAASPFLAAVYLVSWSLQFGNEALFAEIDANIGAFPFMFSTLPWNEPLEYHGSFIDMSYVHCTAFLIISTIGSDTIFLVIVPSSEVVYSSY